jgi:hypothetical protein
LFGSLPYGNPLSETALSSDNSDTYFKIGFVSRKVLLFMVRSLKPFHKFGLGSARFTAESNQLPVVEIRGLPRIRLQLYSYAQLSSIGYFLYCTLRLIRIAVVPTLYWMVVLFFYFQG